MKLIYHSTNCHMPLELDVIVDRLKQPTDWNCYYRGQFIIMNVVNTTHSDQFVSSLRANQFTLQKVVDCPWPEESGHSHVVSITCVVMRNPLRKKVLSKVPYPFLRVKQSW